ncbi:MAG: hypothetical protein NVSMB38_28230 [Ktedonobacteraceae bacterium]
MAFDDYYDDSNATYHRECDLSQFVWWGIVEYIFYKTCLLEEKMSILFSVRELRNRLFTSASSVS